MVGALFAGALAGAAVVGAVAASATGVSLVLPSPQAVSATARVKETATEANRRHVDSAWPIIDNSPARPLTTLQGGESSRARARKAAVRSTQTRRRRSAVNGSRQPRYLCRALSQDRKLCAPASRRVCPCLRECSVGVHARRLQKSLLTDVRAARQRARTLISLERHNTATQCAMSAGSAPGE
jgi:hypothetical protein